MVLKLKLLRFVILKMKTASRYATLWFLSFALTRLPLLGHLPEPPGSSASGAIAQMGSADHSALYASRLQQGLQTR